MELTRFQKTMLAVLAGMLVFFSVLMAVFRARPGVAFEGSLLKIEKYEGYTVYSGKAHGNSVAIRVTPHPEYDLWVTVVFAIPGVDCSSYSIAYPTASVETKGFGLVDGVAVRKDGQQFFVGGYDRENDLWFDADGNPSLQFSIRYASGSGPWQGYETTVSQIARFAFGPETAARGDPAIFALAAFLSLVLAAEIAFHKELFRWRHWAAKDPEPSEDYLAFERVGWVILAVVIAAMYLWAMAEIR